MLKPEVIYNSLIQKKIDNNSAINALISLIENSENDKIRIKSIKYLDKIGTKQEKVFNLLENLVVSDSNKDIRDTAAGALKNNFINMALIPLLWSIQTNASDLTILDVTVQTIFEVLKFLKIRDDLKTAKLLFEGIEKIMHKEYAEKVAQLVKEKTEKDESWTVKELAELLERYIFYFFSSSIIE